MWNDFSSSLLLLCSWVSERKFILGTFSFIIHTDEADVRWLAGVKVVVWVELGSRDEKKKTEPTMKTMLTRIILKIYVTTSISILKQQEFVCVNVEMCVHNVVHTPIFLNMMVSHLVVVLTCFVDDKKKNHLSVK